MVGRFGPLQCSARFQLSQPQQVLAQQLKVFVSCKATAFQSNHCRSGWVELAGINKNAAQIRANVVSNKRVGQYHQLIINIGDLAQSCRPGNFAAISVGGENSRMVLRRAFAISRVSANSLSGGTMELIVAPHGQGSKWLCAQGEGAILDIVVPLGTAFGIPTEPVQVLLVGGGYGSAPLFGLAEVLTAKEIGRAHV